MASSEPGDGRKGSGEILSVCSRRVVAERELVVMSEKLHVAVQIRNVAPTGDMVGAGNMLSF